MRKEKKLLLHLLVLLLLVVFLSALSGFWLGYFLSKVTTLKQQVDSETYAQEYLQQIIDLTDSDIEDSEIVKNLTYLISQINLDKQHYHEYNESVAHWYKHNIEHGKENITNDNYDVQSIY